MKFTKTFLYTVLSITCAQWANAEVAQSKNDTLDKNIQVAAPKLQTPTIHQPKTNNEGSVSMTKEELARHPDLIVRGFLLYYKITKKQFHFCCLYIENFQKKIPYY